MSSENTAAANFEFRHIDCPVCGHDDPKFLGHRGGDAHHNGSGVKTRIVRCVNCTHQYPDPMPFPSGGDLDDLYVDAEVYFKGHSSEYKKSFGLELLKDFETRLGHRGRYLDVGCAAGEFLWAAKESDWEYEGVDPSSEFIKIGKEHLGVNGRVCVLNDAAFPDGHFDAVSLSSVLEHIYDPYDLMLEIRRVLKPGGLLWFDAPNEDGLYMRAGNLYMKAQRKDWVVSMAPTFPPYHVQGFNPASLRSLLKRADLELEELKIGGGIWEFTGEKTLRKRVEFAAAKTITFISKQLNMGPYMSVWAKRPTNPWNV